MNILVACEESQRVCLEFRRKRHNAFSCDILPTSGKFPCYHIQQDVVPLLNGDCLFTTMDGKNHYQKGKWDMIIAFPPCTHLAVSGARWFKEKAENGIQDEAVKFFMTIAQADCEKIAIENPVGIMSTRYRKPDQIIQPYWFGDNARKKTCLWLKGLRKLVPTDIVDPGPTDKYGMSHFHNPKINGKLLAWNDPRTAYYRSKTFPGIAEAMANQWG